MNRCFALIAALYLVGCASRSAPSPSRAAPEVTLRPDGEVSTYLRDVDAVFQASTMQDPLTARAALGELARRRAPSRLAAEDAAYIANEIDRELALRGLDGGDIATATQAIERALARAEGAALRDSSDASTPGLMLVAEEVYRRAGREDAARWAHTEARAMLDAIPMPPP